MSKPISLLRFQLKVLSTYFNRKTKWNLKVAIEFFSYLFYYTFNWWYYLFLTTFESIKIRNKKLKEVDKSLEKIYDSENQFLISLKGSYKLKGEKIVNLTYGETSYFAIKNSFDFVNLTKDDVFYDLGCGIGKTVFLANILYGCKSIGVDLIPEFVNNANKVIELKKLENIKFITKNIFEQNINDGTVFYITPTCFDKDNMEKLYKKFSKLPKDSRLIVLTKPINLNNLKLLGHKRLFYSWGMADTYYYKVV